VARTQLHLYLSAPQLRSGPTATGGFGLFAIRERLYRLGGRLEINSTTKKGVAATNSGESFLVTERTVAVPQEARASAASERLRIEDMFVSGFETTPYDYEAVIPSGDLIFGDGFESGDARAWPTAFESR